MTTQAERHGSRIRRIRSHYVDHLALALSVFFHDQAERVVDRWLRMMGVKVADRNDPLLPPEEEALLAQVVLRYTMPAMEEVGAFAADMAGSDPFSSGGPSLQALVTDGGTRITRVTEETRRAIMREISEGIRRGYTAQAIANGVPSDGFRGLRSVVEEVYSGRAESIARTEIGMATNGAAIDRAAAAGGIYVQLLDGRECHLFTHRLGPLANGLVVPIAVAQRYRLSHPNCLVGDSLVWAPIGDVEATFTRWFEGEVVTLRTADDKLLTCTPNHPILTDRGWVPAGLLQEGDSVLRCDLGERPPLGRFVPDDQYVPTPIHEIASALGESRFSAAARVPTTPEDFHGDGLDGDVDVVWADGFRHNRFQPSLGYPGGYVPFGRPDVRLGSFLPSRPPLEVLDRAPHAPNGLMGSRGTLAPGFGSDFPHRQAVGLANTSQWPPEITERSTQIRVVHPHARRDLQRRLASRVPFVERGESLNGLETEGLGVGPKRQLQLMQLLTQVLGLNSNLRRNALHAPTLRIELVRVEEVGRREFRGHVYNLETSDHWYVANGIVVHNCRRVILPYRAAWPAMANPVPVPIIAGAR